MGHLRKSGMEPDALILVEDTSRESAMEMMRMKDYLDVLIPRGGASLIASVVENSTVPVIETGTGNCHIYVDEFAGCTDGSGDYRECKDAEAWCMQCM